MAEKTQDADSFIGEQGLLERQRALKSAVRQWENNLIAEGHTRNSDGNERNIRALKARRMALRAEARYVSRALREIRRARTWTGRGVGTSWWRWIGIHR